MQRRFARFAWTVLGINLLVIVWGALVRASRSGEGCGNHWPLCNGVVIPHASQIATLIEFTHRVTTGIAFLSVVLMAVGAFRWFRREPVLPAAVTSLALIITEALLGAGLVLFRYAGDQLSTGRAIYLSAHLINTLLLLGAITLTGWWASGHGPIAWSRGNRWSFGGAVAILLATAVTGAITALGDTLLPVSSLSAGLASDFSAASPLIVRLRILHPMVAIIAGAWVLTVAGRAGRARRIAAWVTALLTLQMASGIVNLLLLAPIWMQLIHLLLADLLWIALVLFTAAVLEASPPASASSHWVSAASTRGAARE